MESEFRLLGALKFDLTLFHPHSDLLALFHDLLSSSSPPGSGEVQVWMERAFGFANDSYRSECILFYEPFLFALSALLLSFNSTKSTSHPPHPSHLPFPSLRSTSSLLSSTTPPPPNSTFTPPTLSTFTPPTLSTFTPPNPTSSNLSPSLHSHSHPPPHLSNSPKHSKWSEWLLQLKVGKHFKKVQEIVKEMNDLYTLWKNTTPSKVASLCSILEKQRNSQTTNN